MLSVISVYCVYNTRVIATDKIETCPEFKLVKKRQVSVACLKSEQLVGHKPGQILARVGFVRLPVFHQIKSKLN